jgi:GNAT superfamily N-acetyltransferase
VTALLTGYDFGLEIVLASQNDVDAVMEIIRLCVLQMRAAGSDQWDDIYPSREILDADAHAGNLYVLKDADVTGAIVLNEAQAPEYAELAWGLQDARPLVVHRLCVDPGRQSAGAGRQLMDFAENLAVTTGYLSIRLDTYTGNQTAMAFYQRRGYQLVGYVRFRRRKLPFACFEFPLR